MSNRKIVFLDPGHGGHDPGAVNRAHNLEEADAALDVCLRAKKLLDRYVVCYLTRMTDVFIPLSKRPMMANAAEADVFVSYHFNSATSQNTRLSYEGFTTRGQNQSDRLCEAILKRHGELFPEQKLRADLSDGDLDKEANFAVLRGTECPSCLIEGEFIHTDHGAKLIASPEARQRMARAVAEGVLEFLGINQEEREDLSPDDSRASAVWLSERLDSIDRQIRRIRETFKI